MRFAAWFSSLVSYYLPFFLAYYDVRPERRKRRRRQHLIPRGRPLLSVGGGWELERHGALRLLISPNRRYCWGDPIGELEPYMILMHFPSDQ